MNEHLERIYFYSKNPLYWKIGYLGHKTALSYAKAPLKDIEDCALVATTFQAEEISEEDYNKALQESGE